MEKESKKKLGNLAEIEDLRIRLEEAEEALRAIRSGEVDALVVTSPRGEEVFTLKGADQPYRVFVEAMNEGAATLDPEGTILYCNNRFAEMLKISPHKVIGSSIYPFIPPANASDFESAFQTGKREETNVDLSFKREDKGLLPVHLSFNSLSGQDLPVVCMVATDLTHHRRYEEEILRSHADLEMKVQERTAELARSERKISEILSSITDCHYTLDKEWRVTQINDQALHYFGMKENDFLGKSLWETFPVLVGSFIEERYRIAISAGIPVHFELRSLITDRWAEIHAYPSEEGLSVYFRDITERKRVEEETRRLLKTVQQEKDRLSALVNSIADEVWFADTEKRFTLANPPALLEFGFSSADGIDVEKLVESLEAYRPDGSPRPVDETPPLRALQGEVVRNQEEIIRTPASGELRHRQVSATPVRDGAGKIIGSVSVVRDITERKRMEEQLRKSHDELEIRVEERTRELKVINEELRTENEERLRVEIELRESEDHLRQLSAELLNAQEKERKRVAQEIHDSIGASLAAVKFKMQNTFMEVGRNRPQTMAALESILPVIQGTIDEARRIQTALRPSTLDDLGILATLNWFCREFESTYSHIRITKEIDIREEEIPDSLKTPIYRVSQEALNNIAKHSKASRVSLSLLKTGRTITLAIQDNGEGFNPAEAHSRIGANRGLGLEGMRERIELSEGSCSIESQKGAGTVIRASWSLSSGKQ